MEAVSIQPALSGAEKWVRGGPVRRCEGFFGVRDALFLYVSAARGGLEGRSVMGLLRSCGKFLVEVWL